MNFLYSTVDSLFCSCRRRRVVPTVDNDQPLPSASVTDVATPALRVREIPQRRDVDLSQWQFSPGGDEEEKKHVVFRSSALLGPARIPVLPNNQGCNERAAPSSVKNRRDAALLRFKSFDPTTQFTCSQEMQAYDPYNKVDQEGLLKILNKHIKIDDLCNIICQCLIFNPVDTHTLLQWYNKIYSTLDHETIIYMKNLSHALDVGVMKNRLIQSLTEDIHINLTNAQNFVDGGDRQKLDEFNKVIEIFVLAVSDVYNLKGTIYKVSKDLEKSACLAAYLSERFAKTSFHSMIKIAVFQHRQNLIRKIIDIEYKNHPHKENIVLEVNNMLQGNENICTVSADLISKDEVVRLVTLFNEGYDFVRFLQENGPSSYAEGPKFQSLLLDWAGEHYGLLSETTGEGERIVDPLSQALGANRYYGVVGFNDLDLSRKAILFLLEEAGILVRKK